MSILFFCFGSINEDVGNVLDEPSVIVRLSEYGLNVVLGNRGWQLPTCMKRKRSVPVTSTIQK
jgi:hypothetical protein